MHVPVNMRIPLASTRRFITIGQLLKKKNNAGFAWCRFNLKIRSRSLKLLNGPVGLDIGRHTKVEGVLLVSEKTNVKALTTNGLMARQPDSHHK